jgi:hypothetical protein
MFMVEQTENEGNDMFWYLDEYNLYGILDSRIIDRVIQKKWVGKYDINSKIKKKRKKQAFDNPVTIYDPTTNNFVLLTRFTFYLHGKLHS